MLVTRLGQLRGAARHPLAGGRPPQAVMVRSRSGSRHARALAVAVMAACDMPRSLARCRANLKPAAEHSQVTEFAQ